MSKKKKRSIGKQAPMEVQSWTGANWDPEWVDFVEASLGESRQFPWFWRNGLLEHDFFDIAGTGETSDWSSLIGYIVERINPQEIYSASANAAPAYEFTSEWLQHSEDPELRVAVYTPATRAAQLEFQNGPVHPCDRGSLVVFNANLHYRHVITGTDTSQLIPWITLVYKVKADEQSA